MVIASEALASCPRDHETIYQQWFSYIDSDCDGRITGDEAKNFFAMSNVENSQLKQVWSIADSKRQGFLGFKEFIVAMQLINLAQAGYSINADLVRNMDLIDVAIIPELLQPPLMEGLYSLLMKQNDSPETNNSPETIAVPQTRCCLLNRHDVERLLVEQVSPKILFTSRLSKAPSVIDGLKILYEEKLKPLEVAYHYNDFALPLLTDSDFDAKPMVMLLGQYSTGKTTFIKHFLKCNYPGAHIGPEPTTDRFIVVMGGPNERRIPGNTVAVHGDLPFSALTSFGSAFLSKFECSQMPHPLLENITFVDTPGVLSGEMQHTQRSYDFSGVIKWFAQKCHLILLLFDPTKLDICDEFKRIISSFRGQEDKIRVVLNKAHLVDAQQLMRVYGALMWSLGKVLNTPEVARVYIGSFDDKSMNKELADCVAHELFQKEEDDLVVDLMDIPKQTCDRRVHEFVKRARAVKIHAYIISQLKKEMPVLMGKSKAKQKLIKNLEHIFTKVQKEFHLSAGDFPDVERFRKVLGEFNIDKFEKLKPKMIEDVDDMLANDIPDFLKNFRNPYE